MLKRSFNLSSVGSYALKNPHVAGAVAGGAVGAATSDNKLQGAAIGAGIGAGAGIMAGRKGLLKGFKKAAPAPALPRTAKDTAVNNMKSKATDANFSEVKTEKKPLLLTYHDKDKGLLPRSGTVSTPKQINVPGKPKSPASDIQGFVDRGF